MSLLTVWLTAELRHVMSCVWLGRLSALPPSDFLAHMVPLLELRYILVSLLIKLVTCLLKYLRRSSLNLMAYMEYCKVGMMILFIMLILRSVGSFLFLTRESRCTNFLLHSFSCLVQFRSRLK